MQFSIDTSSKSFSFRKVARVFSNGGVILMIAAILALWLANSRWAGFYEDIWHMPVFIQIGNNIKLFTHHGEPMTLINFINDALMAVFFLAVGLEIKREILVGELSSPKKAMLPVVAAIGGMIVPVAVFFTVANEYPASNGLPIPMATDIAFSLGILSMLGKRVPISLKVFLTTLAVADDIGGIVIIAVKYTSNVDFHYLLIALGLFVVLFIGAYFRIYAKMFYLTIGFIIWSLFLQSGIHPTIAGVLLAFAIPAKPKMGVQKYVRKIHSHIRGFVTEGEEEKKEIILTHAQIDTLNYVESASRKVISPLQAMEEDLHPVVAYLIMPLFAFANAGVHLSGLSIGDMVSGVSLAVILGLFVGKFVGIFAFSYAYIKMGFSSMPTNVNFKQIAGASFLGGIGFTVSLFIANLSYGALPEVGAHLLDQAKLGILVGSFLSGIVGYMVLRKVLPLDIPVENEYND